MRVILAAALAAAAAMTTTASAAGCTVAEIASCAGIDPSVALTCDTYREALIKASKCNEDNDCDHACDKIKEAIREFGFDDSECIDVTCSGASLNAAGAMLAAAAFYSRSL